MTSATEAGGAFAVYLSPEFVPGRVLVGTKESIPATKRKYTMTSIPLTPYEARQMALWLNSAADGAEGKIVEQKS
jgi:hypothetical protein